MFLLIRFALGRHVSDWRDRDRPVKGVYGSIKALQSHT